MKLLILRHADAGDADVFSKSGKPDSERPLSRKGHDQIAEVASALCALVQECDVLATSPYVRARETAEYVAKAYGVKRLITTDALVPEAAPEKFVKWARDNRVAGTVIVVGHEPHLSTLASWLTAGATSSFIDLKKAGACLIAMDQQPGRGVGRLQWLMTAKQLAAIASR